MRKLLKSFFILAVSLGCGASSAQVAEEVWTLVVNDQSGKVTLFKVGGKVYVDVERLAQIARHSISFEGNRINLDLSCSTDVEAAKKNDAEQHTELSMSREFIKASIEEISLMREWASALANAMQNGYPVAESWIASYRAQAETGLQTTSAVISNEADRNAFQLLNHEYEAVQAWSSKLLEARKSMGTANYALSPGSLQNEPLSKKIVSCAHFLGQMLASSSFRDDPSCH